MKNTRWVKQPIFGIINNHIIDYPTPINLSYFYGFGSLAGVLLVIQLAASFKLGTLNTLASNWGRVPHSAPISLIILLIKNPVVAEASIEVSFWTLPLNGGCLSNLS